MTSFGKYVVGVLGIGAILGALSFFNLTPFHSSTYIQGVGSAAGTTFNTAKYAGVTINLATPGASGTSTSILNTDAFDRIVTGIRVGCAGLGTSQTAYTGAGLVSLQIRIATTTTSAPAANGNTNLIASPLVIATSTGWFTVASSTAGNLATTSFAGPVGTTGSTLVNNVWLTGSYMTFTSNATNTGACTVGVDYIGS